MIKNPDILRHFERNLLVADFHGSTIEQRIKRCADCHAAGTNMLSSEQRGQALTPHTKNLITLATAFRRLARSEK